MELVPCCEYSPLEKPPQMTENRTDRNDNGSNHPNSADLDDVCDAISDIRSELREVTESIRELNDSLRELVGQQVMQREAQAAIAATILMDPKIGVTTEMLRHRAKQLTEALAV